MTKGHLHKELKYLQSTKPNDNNLYINNIKRNIAILKNAMLKDNSIRTILLLDEVENKQVKNKHEITTKNLIPRSYVIYTLKNLKINTFNSTTNFHHHTNQ